MWDERLAVRLSLPLLLPLSWLYAAVMRLRAMLYRTGILRSGRVEAPVVCVGNLTCGGSGKTPVVMHVCGLLRAAGWFPAVVSRGYRGAAAAGVNLVSDGRKVRLTAVEAGDEPFMIARCLPGVPVITSSKRFDGARFAVEQLGADVVVLDDGFQHLALARDADLVLFSAATLLGSGRTLPAGVLREPVSALARARAFVITGAEDGDARVERFREWLEEKFPGRPVFLFGLEYTGLVDAEGKETAPAGGRVFAFCGLAAPDGFRRTLAAAGFDVAGFRAFPDHYAYRGRDLAELAAEAEECGAGLLLTTEKDLVKIDPSLCPLPLAAVRTKIVPDPGFEPFLRSVVG